MKSIRTKKEAESLDTRPIFYNLEVIKWGCQFPFPRDDTLAYRMLAITAISGEVPSDALPLFHFSLPYAKNVLYSLTKMGMLQTFYQDKLRGYRLTSQAKSELLKFDPARFAIALTGETETNRIKNQPIRRSRLHNLAELNIMMNSGGAAIFPDQKPDIFTADYRQKFTVNFSLFYTSRDIKRMSKEDTLKLSGSRMGGLLLTPNNAYVTYNSRNGLLELDYRYEQRCHTLITDTLCTGLFSEQYQHDQIYGLMFGKDYSIVQKLLQSSETNLRNFFLLDSEYEHFYYLTCDRYGITLLKLLCNPAKQSALNRILLQDLRVPKRQSPFDCDGFDEKGTPVLFGYFMDIPRIDRFSICLGLHKKKGIVICFDFQQDALSHYLDKNITLQAISFEKFERSFFPSKNAKS